MYDELIAELRQHHCDAKEDDTQEVCEECCYDVIIVDKSAPSGFASVCACGLMNRAADAIEDLIAALTASNEVIAKSKPRWIPVTELLPEDDTGVLAHVYWPKYGDTMVCYGHWHKGWCHLYHHVEGELISGYVVTHWMPLPQPPKEG